MAIIDIDNMYWEMQSTMRANFQGTAEERYNEAKSLFLESVGDCIDQNKKDLIKEVRESLEK